MWQEEDLVLSYHWDMDGFSVLAGPGGKDRGQHAWCLIITSPGDRVLVTRLLLMNGLFVLIYNTALPKVPGSKKHEPKDRKTCWPDGALIKIKMGIAHLFQWLWFLNELLPRLSGSKWGRGEYGLQICPLAGSAGSKLYYPGIRWGRGWQLRPQRAVNQKALCTRPFALVFLPQDSWFPRVLTVLCFTLGSHLVSME